MHPKNDAVGMQGVVDGEPFAQELRIPGHLHGETVGGEGAGAFTQLSGGTHRDGRLADDDGRAAQQRHQGVDHGIHVPQIGAVLPLLLRGAHAEEVHVGEFRRFGVVGGEPQATLVDVALQHLSKTGLVERDVATGEFGDLAGVDVDADDVVAEFGHSHRMGRAEVSRAEDGASHTGCIGSRDELTAKRH